MSREITFANPYARDRSGIGAIDFKGRSRTKQEFRNECDINVIMARYKTTGVFPVAVKVGSYGDFSESIDFQSSLEILKKAQAQFAGLPAKVRDRFKNDPAAFLDFVHDKSNLEECAALGLLSDEAAKRIAEAKKAPAKPEPDKKV